jgi:hypothetical protein
VLVPMWTEAVWLRRETRVNSAHVEVHFEVQRCDKSKTGRTGVR